MGWFDELKKQSPNLDLYEQLVENRERLDEKLDEYLQRQQDEGIDYAPIIGDIKAAIVENEKNKKRIMDKAMGREE